MSIKVELELTDEMLDKIAQKIAKSTLGDKEAFIKNVVEQVERKVAHQYEEEVFSLEETRRILNISKATIYRWASSGKIRTIGKGKSKVITKSELTRISNGINF